MNLLITTIWKGLNLGFLAKLGIIGIIVLIIVVLIILAIGAFILFKYMKRPR